MVALVFGDLAHTIHKVERLLEVGKAELTLDVMLLGDGPVGDAPVKLFQFFSVKWRHASAAGHAVFVS